VRAAAAEVTTMLRDFYFDHEGLFVIPIEHLGPTGMSTAFKAELTARGRDDAWIELFDAAFSTYFERATQLFATAPETWFPPRAQHVCVVTDPERVRPYSQPIEASSWLFYEEDFDPERSGVELASYLFFHTERLGLSGNILAAAVHNLAYFLVQTPAAIEAFVADTARCQRPDAACFVALAEAMPWIRRLYHAKLKTPSLVLPEPLGKLEAADLLVPMSLQGEVKKLAQTFKDDAQAIVQRYYARFAVTPGRDEPRDALIAHLRQDPPRALVATEGGQILWDPDHPDDIERVAAVTAGIAPACAESIQRDLAVIGRHTERFMAALAEPDALPDPHDLDQEAGTYIHESRKLIAYDLRHPLMNRLREPSLPLERWMLGARTIHEWGHLAVEADLVTVSVDRLSEFAEAQAGAASTIDELIAKAPASLQRVAETECEQLAGSGGPGERLFGALMGRMDDYQANVLARRFLSAEEMETYARANVVSLAREPGVGPWMRLVRHTYELQYLCLGRLEDPFAYFTSSVWFDAHFVQPKLVDEAGAKGLFEAVSRVCACYSIDVDGFVAGGLPAEPEPS
jgi:hypothetical protein